MSAWTTPGRNQGQAVIYSYAWVDGSVYERREDRGAPPTAPTYRRLSQAAQARLPEDWEPRDGVSALDDNDWIECDDPSTALVVSGQVTP